MAWSEAEKLALIANYPTRGIEWCMQQLNKTRPQVRSMASTLKLRIDRSSPFFKEWQKRAKLTKIGKKRPVQSEIMKAKAREGELPITKWVKENGNLISEQAKQRIATNGHPKGMLGKRHTSETKQVISGKAKQMWENMTEETRDAYSARASINGQKQTMNRANSSWKAGWREIGGYKKYYRSRWEANYARYLEWLKSNNQIADWKHESKTFWFEGIKRGCMSYLPDFWVKELNGFETYHEIKK